MSTSEYPRSTRECSVLHKLFDGVDGWVRPRRLPPSLAEVLLDDVLCAAKPREPSPADRSTPMYSLIAAAAARRHACAAEPCEHPLALAEYSRSAHARVADDGVMP